MQTNLPGEASQRGWLRIARGGITLAALLAVLAFAVSFMDLSAFSSTPAADNDSPGLSLFDNAAPDNVDRGSPNAGQGPVIVLNDWVYASGNSKPPPPPPPKSTTPTKPTKKTQTKSPVQKKTTN